MIPEDLEILTRLQKFNLNLGSTFLDVVRQAGPSGIDPDALDALVAELERVASDLRELARGRRPATVIDMTPDHPALGIHSGRSEKQDCQRVCTPTKGDRT